jgi:hypothetical protein
MPRNFMGGATVRLSSTSQSIACATTSTAIGNAFGAQTWAVRLAVSGTGNTHYRIGDGVQTAVTTDPFLPNAEVEYIIVAPGQRISAITESGTATMTVTELVE